MAEKKVTGWFTMNGKHIPIFEGESKDDAVNRAVAKANEDKKAEQIAKNQRTANSLNGKKTVVNGKEAVATLNSLDSGTPVQVKLNDTLDYKQALYMGKGEVQGREVHQFYDGSGVDGVFGLSDRYLSNGGVNIKLDDNDPGQVAKLTQAIKTKEKLK